MTTTRKQRIDSAITMAIRFGGIDGGHHKAWVIDQMIRALTGCPALSTDNFGTCAEYERLIAESCDGEGGPNTYTHDTGITP